MGTGQSSCSPTLRWHSKRWRNTSALFWIGPRQLTLTPWIPQQPVQVSLAKPLTIEEIKKAIHRIIFGRTSGKDDIPAEIYKAAGPDALEAFHDVLLTVWEEGMMPADFRDALIVSLHKKKGCRTAVTTGVFPSSQLQERSLRESSLTNSSQSPNRPSLRHSAASGLVGAL